MSIRIFQILYVHGKQLIKFQCVPGHTPNARTRFEHEAACPPKSTRRPLATS